MTIATLDERCDAAREALARRGAPAPDALLLLGTGVGRLPAAYRSVWRLPLETLPAMPPCWRSGTLHAAEASGATFWVLTDSPGDEAEGNAPEAGEAPWERAFPCWLAADAGAALCVHGSAGSSLPAEQGVVAAGTIAVASDHLNLSGRTPLRGLGGSRLGPLFPDLTHLHHAGLRRIALQRASEHDIPCAEAVVACTSGPTLDTPAERRFYARAGAHVAVQGLADPLLAAAHAGLACLALVAVIADEEASSIPHQVEYAERLAPALDALLDALAPDLALVAAELREEGV